MTDKATRGNSFPLGPTVYRSGVNFSVYSQSATGIQLLFFNRGDYAGPACTIEFDRRTTAPAITGTYLYRSAGGKVYGYRVQGPFNPGGGNRFDPDKVLVDPYGKCISAQNYSRIQASMPGDNAAVCMKSVVADFRTYDWRVTFPYDGPSRKPLFMKFMLRGLPATRARM